MDIDVPPNPEISFQTVFGAVKRQNQEMEAKVDAKISEKIGYLCDEIHGTNQCMKNQHTFVKDEYIYDNFDFKIIQIHKHLLMITLSMSKARQILLLKSD